jgi:hypothetical protein
VNLLFLMVWKNVPAVLPVDTGYDRFADEMYQMRRALVYKNMRRILKMKQVSPLSQA